MFVKIWSATITKSVLLGLIFILTTFSSSFAQWESDVRLTFDSAESYTSFNNARFIAATGDTVHIAWNDARDGDTEIYYKRSLNGGISWEADQRLTNAAENSRRPSVAISGPTVHVVWFDFRDINEEIYYKRSTDAGISWGPDERLTNASGSSYSPSATVLGQNVHIVWRDYRAGNYEVYYKRSTNAGSTWEAAVRLTNDAAPSYYPCVVASGSYIHVVWYDERDGDREIYYKQSDDEGVTWGPDTRLTYSVSESYRPCISVSDSNLHVVWQEDRDGNREIYYKRSFNAGTTWGTDTRLTFNPAYSYRPSVEVSGANVHVIWYEYRPSDLEIYYLRSTDGGNNWESEIRLTNATGYSRYQSATVSDSMLHITWYDERDGNAEIYYKRNPTGNAGIEEISLQDGAKSNLRVFPNPMNRTAQIKYALSKDAPVSLKIYNISGSLIWSLYESKKIAGSYTEIWTGRDDNNRLLPSGIYTCILESKKIRESRKIFIVR